MNGSDYVQCCITATAMHTATYHLSGKRKMSGYLTAVREMPENELTKCQGKIVIANFRFDEPRTGSGAVMHPDPFIDYGAV